MTEMRAQLVLTADGTSLKAATAQAGRDFQGLINKTTGVDRAARSARESYSVWEQELERVGRQVDNLRASYDPLWAAGQRLKAGEDALRRAFALGQIEMMERDRLLAALRAEYAATTAAQTRMAAGMAGLTTATRGGAGGMTNFSYQLQDIFTQVGMGVPLLISLGQQAPQILSGFGQVGAILGVVAAAVLPLSAAIFGLGYDSRRTAEDVKTLEDALTEAHEAVNQSIATTTETSLSNLESLRDRYGEINAELLWMLKGLQELDQREARQQVGAALGQTFENASLADYMRRVAAVEPIAEAFRREIAALEAQLPVSIDKAGLEREIAALRRDLEATLRFDDIAADFRISPDVIREVEDLRNRIKDALAGGELGDAVAPVERLMEILREIPGGPLAEMQDGLLEAYELLRLAEQSAAKSSESIEEIETALDAATRGGRALGDALAAAVGPASDIANALARAAADVASIASFSDLASVEDRASANRLGLDGAARDAFIYAQRIERRMREAGADDAQIAATVAEARRRALEAYSGAEDGKKGRGGSGGGGDTHRQAVRAIEAAIGDLAGAYERDVAAAERWRAETLANLDPAKAGFEAFAEDVETIYQDRLAKAYEADLERRTDWAAGIERGLAEIEDEFLSWADVTETLVTGWSSGLEDAFVQLGMTGKAEMKDLVDFTLEQFLRLAYQRAVQPAFNGLFDTLLGGVAGLFGQSPVPAGAAQSHSGSIIGRSSVATTLGGLRPDERLTVTTLGQRVFTPSQIEHGAAVVDALAMAASRSNAGQVVVIEPRINNYTSAAVETRQGPDGTLEIDIFDKIERSMAGRMQTPGAPLNRAVRTMTSPRYGRGQG
jgi:hypothetical protein